MNKAVLPLVHFMFQSIRLMRSMDICRNINANQLAFIYNGELFDFLAENSPEYSQVYNRFTDVFRNKARKDYHFDEAVLHVNTFVDDIKQVQNPGEVTDDLILKYFTILKLLWQRSECITNVELRTNTTEIMPKLISLRKILLLEYPPPLKVPDKCYALNSLIGYYDVLLRNPETPAEAFLFSIDYELATKHGRAHSLRTKKFFVTQRLPIGMVYKP